MRKRVEKAHFISNVYGASASQLALCNNTKKLHINVTPKLNMILLVNINVSANYRTQKHTEGVHGCHGHGT